MSIRGWIGTNILTIMKNKKNWRNKDLGIKKMANNGQTLNTRQVSKVIHSQVLQRRPNFWVSNSTTVHWKSLSTTSRRPTASLPSIISRTLLQASMNTLIIWVRKETLFVIALAIYPKKHVRKSLPTWRMQSLLIASYAFLQSVCSVSCCDSCNGKSRR